MTGSYALALAAGVLASVNPCGFALLPAYASFLILDEADTARSASVRRALLLTAAMTAGFVLVFGGFGLLAAPAADAIARTLPWVTVVVGLVLVVLGGWLLSGRQLPGPKLVRGPGVTRGFGSMVLFGASYAIASLGCTIGPFLAVVVSGFRTGSVADGVGLFLAYALGMALVVGAVAVAVALARTAMVARLRRAAPVVNRLGGALLAVVGAYVAWYGWYEIRVLRDPATTDPVIDTAARVQIAISTAVDTIGAAGFAAVVLVLMAGAWLWQRTRG